MKKKKKHSRAEKIIIGITGSLFLLYGIFLAALWLAGTLEQAKITNVRREMGDRNETIRNQYNYVYAYEFNIRI